MNNRAFHLLIAGKPDRLTSFQKGAVWAMLFVLFASLGCFSWSPTTVTAMDVEENRGSVSPSPFPAASPPLAGPVPRTGQSFPSFPPPVWPIWGVPMTDTSGWHSGGGEDPTVPPDRPGSSQRPPAQQGTGGQHSSGGPRVPPERPGSSQRPPTQR